MRASFLPHRLVTPNTLRGCAIAAASCSAFALGADAQASLATEPTASAAASRVTITTGKSEFGRILFDGSKQAVYIFENDRKNESRCFGECARAWPPVLTSDTPRARGGVKRSLLGTIKRRKGARQVTYKGQPLYYYVNEGPGEVRCHNVFLNGGLWWVLGADGKRKK